MTRELVQGLRFTLVTMALLGGGYTLLVHSSSFSSALSLYKSLPYDTLNDFTPVTNMAMVRKTLEQVRQESKSIPPRKLPKWTDEQIREGAESDPDNPPLTEEQLKRFKPCRERRAAAERELSEKDRGFEDKK